MIAQSRKSFFNNYMMKAVIKDKKRLIDGLRTDIGGMTYTKKLRRTYKRVRNANAVTLFDLKKHLIQPG